MKTEDTVYFYQRKRPHGKFCLELFDMVADGYVRGGTFGYIIIESTKLPKDLGNGHKFGLHLQKTILLEVSVGVNVANQTTIRTGIKNNCWIY